MMLMGNHHIMSEQQQLPEHAQSEATKICHSPEPHVNISTANNHTLKKNIVHPY
jgi:hypothetical protein